MKVRKKIYIVSLSGGKDSTAMLLKLLEMNKPIDYIVFCDTGVEFPEVYRHLKKIDLYLKKWNKSISVLKPKYNFIEYMTIYKAKRGVNKGLPYSFPCFSNRWCCGSLKQLPLFKYKKELSKNQNIIFIDYIGFTIEEKKRAEKLKLKEKENQKYVFPLIEEKMSKKETLAYCYGKGFDWEGLYKYVDRTSCYICPLVGKKKLAYLINYRPELWEIVKTLESNLKEKGIKKWRFLLYKSTKDLEKELKVNKLF